MGTLTNTIARFAPRARISSQERADLFDEAFVRKLGHLRLLTRRKLRPGRPGKHSSRQRGRGLDFADHRAYVPGDDLRHLDWHLYARHERPLVRLHEDETDIAVHLLVDHSASMAFGTPSKLHLAAKLSGALAFLGLAQQDRVTLTAFTDVLEQTFVCASPTRAQAFARLSGLQAVGPTALAQVAHQFLARRPRQGLVFFISDFHDLKGISQALPQLCAAGFDPIFLQVLAPSEIDPARDERLGQSGAVLLEDAESGEQLAVVLGPDLLSAVATAQSHRATALRRLCQRHRVSLVTTLSNAPFDRVVIDTLRRVGLAG